MTEIQDIRQRVQAALSEKRFKHTMGVADEAVQLAKRWGANMNRAYLAGLLHDYAKEISKEETFRILCQCGLEGVCINMRYCPALLHGPLAARLAMTEFDIKDPEVLDAIYYHTTGRANMSLLEKIIYVADFIEPNRCFDGVDDVRRLAYEDIDRAALAEADRTIALSVERGHYLHSDTVEARNYLLIKTKEGKNK